MSRHLLRKALRLPQAAIKRLVTGLLQLVLLANRPARLARSGFVLPTTVLLVLLLTLTATALTYRATSRSTQVIAQREQQVINNSATPAIDRAKAKLEYVFQRDDRIPGGLPSSNVLEAMLTAPTVDLDGVDGANVNYGVASRGVDVYTLPDETRLDINGDGVVDNAWMFLSDINGDGAVDDDEVVAYSILSRASGTIPNTATLRDVTDAPDFNKARALVTRTGPISTAELSQRCRTARAPEGGWQIVNASRDLLQKNFQVDAFVVNRGAGSDLNRTVQTLEFQQSREAARGSKWGAWFRYDLEVFPGPEFKWNGAMHSDSNIFLHDNIKAYMVSSNYSCIYSETASEITLDTRPAAGDDPAYQGEFVLGAVKLNNLNRGGATPEVHIYNGGAPALSGGAGLSLDANNTGKDSIRARANQTVSPSHIGANPLTLFTQGKAEHTLNTSWERDPNWVGSMGERRIINKQERKPFVDDFFRADNRWGPKPAYKNYNMADLNSGGDAGVAMGKDISQSTYPGLTNGEGLDGFWEREAIAGGTRFIVGQRLELGNTFGWNINPRTGTVVANTDPLYPPNASATTYPGYPTTVDKASLGAGDRNYPGSENEVLQRRALRDNLAAVQAMAIYHYETADGEFPRACIALTAHPGTSTTIVNSRTFSNYPALTDRLKTDFFSGQGTNGWEFRFPSAFNTESTFATAIGPGQPLGIALRNLAHFAGDPNGGAPSFEPVQDSVVHPQSHLSMWGDFSPLRRIFDDYLDNSRTYASLSPADKATLHTAACTLGMLAYNIKNEVDEFRVLDTSTFPSSLQDVTTRVGNLVNDIISYMGGTNLTGSNGTNIVTILNARNLGRAGWLAKCPTYASTLFSAYTESSPPPACGLENYFASFKLDDWIALIPFAPGNIPASAIPDLRDVATRVNRIVRLIRDRDLGFRQGTAVTPLAATFTTRVAWDPATGVTDPVSPQGSGNYRFRTLCDPNIFRTVGANGPGGDDNVVIAGLLACSDRNVEQVLYPSLYYLFPIVPHDHDGADYHSQPGNPTETVDDVQTPEEYITNPYVTTTNSGYTYRVVGSDPLEGLNDIALVPAASNLSGWAVPPVPQTDRLLQNNFGTSPFRINLPNLTSSAEVAFLDEGMYDGREQMAIRVLDIDVKRLTSTRNGTGDYWITDNKEKEGEGIVFAYREDAVREDEIVRPKNSSATEAACTTVTAATGPARPRFALETNANCRMIAVGTPQDPPLTSIKASLKPVDFAPDPERRPHGFRLRRGEDVSYGKRRTSGLTFVTDNSVYIQGDFNLHSSNGALGTNGGNLIEEFTAKLRDNAGWGPGDFYGTNTPATGRHEALLNTDTQFSVLTYDHWRPVEILADSIGILSANFRNGAISNAFTNPTNNTGSSRVSYQNQNRPYFTTTNRTAADWVQENNWQGAAATTFNTAGVPSTPIWVDRNGVYQTTAYNPPTTTGILGGVTEYLPLTNRNNRDDNVIPATPTNVNASFVSGIVPSRAYQSYGGFHNFPRLNEDWDAQDLYISGSFFQLDFSTAATGPFDQDAWEPGDDPHAIAGTDEYIPYYRPPNRRWGYDVALQYVPPAPVSRRFVTYGSPRSEYYRELSTDDPYMVLLRCAQMPNGDRIDPRVDVTQCPA